MTYGDLLEAIQDNLFPSRDAVRETVGLTASPDTSVTLVEVSEALNQILDVHTEKFSRSDCARSFAPVRLYQDVVEPKKEVEKARGVTEKPAVDVADGPTPSCSKASSKTASPLLGRLRPNAAKEEPQGRGKALKTGGAKKSVKQTRSRPGTPVNNKTLKRAVSSPDVRKLVMSQPHGLSKLVTSDRLSPMVSISKLPTGDVTRLVCSSDVTRDVKPGDAFRKQVLSKTESFSPDAGKLPSGAKSEPADCTQKELESESRDVKKASGRREGSSLATEVKPGSVKNMDSVKHVPSPDITLTNHANEDSLKREEHCDTSGDVITPGSVVGKRVTGDVKQEPGPRKRLAEPGRALRVQEGSTPGTSCSDGQRSNTSCSQQQANCRQTSSVTKTTAAAAATTIATTGTASTSTRRGESALPGNHQADGGSSSSLPDVAGTVKPEAHDTDTTRQTNTQNNGIPPEADAVSVSGSEKSGCQSSNATARSTCFQNACKSDEQGKAMSRGSEYDFNEDDNKEAVGCPTKSSVKKTTPRLTRTMTSSSPNSIPNYFKPKKERKEELAKFPSCKKDPKQEPVKSLKNTALPAKDTADVAKCNAPLNAQASNRKPNTSAYKCVTTSLGEVLPGKKTLPGQSSPNGIRKSLETQMQRLHITEKPTTGKVKARVAGRNDKTSDGGGSQSEEPVLPVLEKQDDEDSSNDESSPCDDEDKEMPTLSLMK